MRIGANAGYIVVLLAGGLFIAGAFAIGDSLALLVVLPLLLLVFVLAFVIYAIGMSREPDS